jgi:uncharacterized protein YndB with AHSA1/START domain
VGRASPRRRGATAAVEASIEIRAPIERVWETIADPHRLGEWMTLHRSLDDVSGDPGRPGSTLKQTLCLRGARFPVRWRLLKSEPPRRLRYEGRGPARSSAVVEDRLTKLDGATRVDYRNEFRAPAGPLGAAAARILMGGIPEREAQRSLRRLKALLES